MARPRSQRHRCGSAELTGCVSPGNGGVGRFLLRGEIRPRIRGTVPFYRTRQNRNLDGFDCIHRRRAADRYRFISGSLLCLTSGDTRIRTHPLLTGVYLTD